MRRLSWVLAAVAGTMIGMMALWRRNPRIGTRFVNERVDPFLVARGWSGSGRAEIGTLEHFGRKSGTRRLTPVHPERTEDGIRIIMPLGMRSEWARNVLAAGHCRMQLHGIVHQLDEPAVLLPREMADLPGVTRVLCGLLGFTYMRLHRFAETPGSLDAEAAAGSAGAEPGAVATAPAETRDAGEQPAGAAAQ